MPLLVTKHDTELKYVQIFKLEVPFKICKATIGNYAILNVTCYSENLLILKRLLFSVYLFNSASHDVLLLFVRAILL